MKPVSPALETYLNTRREIIYADGYTIILRDDTVHRFTTSQYNFTGIPYREVDPVTFYAGRLLISGLRFKTGIGVEVDEQTIDITPYPNFTINQLPVLEGLKRGQYDGARIKRDRFFFNEWGEAPVGSIGIFTGKVSTIDRIGRVTATMKVKSELVLLVSPSPREVYQPQCLNTLFDARCKLDPDDYAVQGTVESGSTASVINWTDSLVDAYDQGIVRWESGPNVGAVRTIRKSYANNFVMTLPLPETPIIGDDFVVFPGCDKSKTTCDDKFSNGENFRGFPFIPPPETAY